MDVSKRWRCANCRQGFRADARNAWHQRYCKAPACRAASKAASQRRWLDKPENRDYFCGAEHVERMRAWRQEHPVAKTRSTGVAAAPSPVAPIQDLVSLWRSSKLTQVRSRRLTHRSCIDM